jgi:hypothetical protein
MSTNAIKRNSSKCKYVEIFTHHVDSIGELSRKTVLEGQEQNSENSQRLLGGEEHER